MPSLHGRKSAVWWDETASRMMLCISCLNTSEIGRRFKGFDRPLRSFMAMYRRP